jgi:predicted CXXCH cytochrome family protein
LEVSTCQACHETALSKPFLKSYHAGLENSCASCHKGAAEHSEAMQAGKGRRPAPSLSKLKASRGQHGLPDLPREGEASELARRRHDRRGLSCISCHAVHNYQSEQHQLKTAADPATCYTCHAAVRAKTLRTSHHPIREGLMTCGACHNPHDSTTPKMISADGREREVPRMPHREARALPLGARPRP